MKVRESRKKNYLGFLTMVAMAFCIGLISVRPALAQANIQEYYPLGDIEGIPTRWKTLEQLGLIAYNNTKKTYEVAKPNAKLWFQGDLARRGPYGMRTYTWANSLIANDPTHAMGIIGNHDVNGLWPIMLRPVLDLGLNEEYNSWLKSKGIANSLGAQIDWFRNKWGLIDKTVSFWTEMAANKLNVDPTDSEFQKSIREGNKLDGKISEAALSKFVNLQEMAEAFIKYHGPGGPVWKYLQKASVIHVEDTREGVRIYGTHAPIYNENNFGTVPGKNFRYYEKYADQDWLKMAANDWNEYKDNQLKTISRLLSEIESIQKSAGVSNLNGLEGDARIRATDLANELLQNQLVRYLDAGYDPVTKQINSRTSSPTYPNKPEMKFSSLPGVPQPATMDLIASSRVDITTGGHVPGGDTSDLRRGYSFKFKKFVRFLMTDTSYSGIEGTDVPMITSKGDLRISGQTRNGLVLMVEMPGEKTLDEWRRGTDERLKQKAERIDRIGMVSNGYVILGFEGKKNPQTGQIEVAYDKYILLKQNGFNFDYLSVPEREIVKTQLKFPVADFEKLFEESYRQKLNSLKALGRMALDEETFKREVSGKKVIASSSSADASLALIMDSATGNPEVVRAYLKHWRLQVEALPLNGEYVHLTGGTDGVERLKNQIISDVNEKRLAASGRPIEMIGALPLSFQEVDLDPNIKKFVLTRAYFYKDYMKEVLVLLSKSKPASLTFQFAAGGSNLPDQIRQVREANYQQSIDARIELYQGLSDKKTLSATDEVVRQVEADPARNLDVQVIKVTEYPKFASPISKVPVLSPARVGEAARCHAVFLSR